MYTSINPGIKIPGVLIILEKGLIFLKEIINSEQNKRIKSLKKLYNKRTRRNKGKFILEGYRIIEEALKSMIVFDNIYMTPDFFQSKQGQSIVFEFEKKYSSKNIIMVEDKILNMIADTHSPQGIIGTVNEREYLLDEVFMNKGTLLLLDRIQDPGNMGTIIRTAVAAGIDGIIVLKGSVDIYNLKVLRSTMGAIFKIPLIQDLELEDFLDLFTNSEYKLVSTDLSADKYYYQLDFPHSVIIAIGNEANGLQEELLAKSDYRIKIPIIGEIESLNAAIAAGIILYKVIENNWK